jgi:hypothetical protein
MQLLELLQLVISPVAMPLSTQGNLGVEESGTIFRPRVRLEPRIRIIRKRQVILPLLSNSDKAHFHVFPQN